MYQKNKTLFSSSELLKPKINNEIKKIKTKDKLKKDAFDLNNSAALIDKSKEKTAKKLKTKNDVTQDQVRNIENSQLTLSEEDALKAQIFGCWSIPLGLPYDENLIVRIKIKLEPDGTVTDTEILDHARMNKPGQRFYKVSSRKCLKSSKIMSTFESSSFWLREMERIRITF